MDKQADKETDRQTDILKDRKTACESSTLMCSQIKNGEVAVGCVSNPKSAASILNARLLWICCRVQGPFEGVP